MSSALTSTLAENTVQMALTMTVSAATKTIHVAGTGKFDLTAKSAAMAITVTGAGQSAAVTMAIVGSTAYLHSPQITSLPAGKSWIALPVTANQGGSSASTAPGGVLGKAANPSSFLPFLQRAGATVQTLGTTTFDGTSVTGYRISMSQSAIQSLLAKAMATQHLPSSAAGHLFSTLHVGTATVTIYVGGGLLRGLELTVQMSAAGSTIGIKGTLHFTGYGQPVTVQAPPATQVVTASQQPSAATAGLGLLTIL